MMVIGTFLIFLLLALLILFFLKQLWTRRHLPPGPLALPLVGTFFAAGLWLREDYFRKPVKRYGNIYSLFYGHQLSILLSGFKAVKEGMTNFPEELCDRPDNAFLNDLGKGRGIIFSNGNNWKQQRRIGITSLRKLGLGKKSIEHQIEDAAQTLVEIFRQTEGQPFNPSFSVLNAVSNIICALSFGHQFSAEDEEFKKLVQALQIILKFLGNTFQVVYDLFPQLMKYLPGPHKKALASMDIMLAFAKQEIEKHKESHCLHEPQDFIDYYLLQMEKSRNDPDSTYSEENLAQCIFDFFTAGTDTTLATLMWALLLLTNHPDIQDKVQKEIEDVFGSSGSISYQDRKKLPYTNAVIHEMQRVKYILLYGIPRQSTKDVTMRGYHIPKGTIIVPDLHSVLLDPEQWETPEKFNPNHFLDKDGKFIDREEFLPFGMGLRVCVGQQLARIEVFIFLTSLLRAFSFRLPEGVKELSEEPVAKMIMHPRPYKLCAIPTQA
ncbi:cytochrome P450 2J5-like isoform X1 [Pantherophis guttatus]|uniref:Cytochrome P450 2J5-like isoform X1 n=1 Tax=Pantherophis guttatus TaxID=94885 RepID=A0A6P9DPV0_PANGU|nr:cytochrome P450 2J5-like isoform X1 [Pantherophis guttatus]XP_034297859.1 cytochrome P450 2J5-like isoform X1 [Pantherophis guttatus]